MGWSHIHVWWIKIQEGYRGSEESQPHTRPPSPGSQCQEEKSPNFWLQKPAGTEAVDDRNFWSPKQFPLKNPHTDLLRLMPSELQWWGSKWKGIRDVQGGTEVSGIKASRGHGPFSKPSTHTAGKLVPYQRLHQPG